jgi:hypothetical protein
MLPTAPTRELLPSGMTNVICAKWGPKYGPEYVNRLRSMVARNLARPHRFVCFTDDPAGLDPAVEHRPMPVLPVPAPHDNLPWRKVALFGDPLADLTGPTLFLDLDQVIVGPLDPFFDYEPGRFCVIHNWTHPDRRVGNTSVYRFEIGAHRDVLDHLIANHRDIFARYLNSQTYVSDHIADMAWWPEAWCRSFKKHCLPGGALNLFLTPKLPEGARIIVFHGDPKPEDAVAGRWPGRLTKFVRPTPWIAEHWR